MSTLAEIESAVDTLPLADQEKLYSHLARRIRRRSSGSAQASAPERTQREWVESLARLRASIGTGKTGGPTTEDILADLRSERV
jgi:hypothetical protein